jgi:hypothetical protein
MGAPAPPVVAVPIWPRSRAGTAQRGVLPLSWFEIIQLAAKELGAALRVGKKSWGSLGRGVLLSWAPNGITLAGCAIGAPVVYLCWGGPADPLHTWRYRLKIWRLRYILRRASLLLVNDLHTATDIFRWSGRRPTEIPYGVDCDFFSYNPPESRAGFLLVPGNNDRDEQCVLGLADGGEKIVRVTNDPGTRAFYEARAHPGVTVRFAVTFEELRDLYQTAGAVLMPVLTANHAAGQTSALEALACGAPLIVTAGSRLATIVGGFPAVSQTPSNAPADWARALECLRHEEPAGLGRTTLATTQAIRRKHDVYVVRDELSRAIAHAGNWERGSR